ncbi:MAG: RNB domain-containing ribonuclease [Acidimicrobiales bacterium]|nr:RNB domain-containing ribonuclease [Acidimicrobiales bacterium]
MQLRRLHCSPDLHLDLDAIRLEFELPGPFTADAQAEAAALALLPAERLDATDLALVTIDPAGSRDLDQAVAVEAHGSGWRVRYAIADVGAWVAPGGAIDRDARARTQTYYAPDRRTPLHPPSLGEQAGSLLPDGDRPAVLWTIDVDDAGETTAIDVARATVRSRAQLTYAEVQAAVDEGAAIAPLAPLEGLGTTLLAAAAARGAIELGLPEQDVVADDAGSWTVELRADLPVEHWNAQISLLTGRAAATLMLDAGFGLLRTVPTADDETVARMRAAAADLQITWAPNEPAGAALRRLDMAVPRHAAFAELATELLRGASYTPLRGQPPADPGHAGVGAPYAHVTAPLRRLVDRFGTEACLAAAAGRALPTWVDEALDGLPDAMAEGDRRGRKFERAVVDATEALVLADRVGDTFPATVVQTGERRGTVVLEEPAVRARCDTSDLPLGEPIWVRCTEADVAERSVRFERTS